MIKLKRFLKGMLGFVVFGVLLVGCWSAAYYVTDYAYDRFGFRLHGLLQMIVNGLLGFFFFGLIISLVSLAFRKRSAVAFKLIVDAMRQIAKGNFNVTLDVKREHQGPFTEIIENINYMAVELNQMEQLRQEFISNVSHEIQSPLTSIRGFARALQDERLSREERNHYLAIIETECVRLAKLSDNLLKLASLESKHQPFEPKRYRLDKQLRSIVLANEPLWLAKRLDMDISLEEIEVWADEILMSQVWVNLLNNSIKFTPEDGTIGIKLARDGQDLLVSLSDSGPGIPPEERTRVFERFYKADKARDRSIGGSGLGLSIVKKIVEMHQGDIVAEAAPGGGALFKVRLPGKPDSS